MPAAAGDQMPPTQSICMIGGDGETSYARNSRFQRGVQSRLTPLVEEAIADLCRAGVPSQLCVADLGCSSSPNALALVSAAVEAVCRRLGNPSPAAERSRPEISVYLNDLLDNDFNTVFKAVPSFLEKHAGAEEGGERPLVLVFGAPGSFYDRLFSAQMLHLVCSSFSLHWLSKVPQELVDGVLINRGNICAGKTSTPAVTAAYTRQFEQDFKLFLASRAKEIIPGGWMIFSMAARPARDFASQPRRLLEFAAEVLQDMASQGMIASEEVDLYNVPVYTPCLEELRGAVELEGSFEVARMESHEVIRSHGDAKQRAAALRGLHDWALVRHFQQVDHIGDEFRGRRRRTSVGCPRR
ncbi:unnamed protein product [Urochloa decumbens]|uniref:Uncharacterized protein n=1 Tax=Urochloa decumbens TaxID=240449 RepID=A0ABC9D628_9POAL